MTANAGWYPDPEMADTRRYWDGSRWTGHIAAVAPPAPVRESDTVLIAGWLCAALFPPVGMGLALSLPARHKSHQPWMLTVSTVLTFAIPVWLIFFALP